MIISEIIKFLLYFNYWKKLKNYCILRCSPTFNPKT